MKARVKIIGFNVFFFAIGLLMAVCFLKPEIVMANPLIADKLILHTDYTHYQHDNALRALVFSFDNRPLSVIQDVKSAQLGTKLDIAKQRHAASKNAATEQYTTFVNGVFTVKLAQNFEQKNGNVAFSLILLSSVGLLFLLGRGHSNSSRTIKRVRLLLSRKHRQTKFNPHYDRLRLSEPVSAVNHVQPKQSLFWPLVK